ncbi:MAG: putative PUA domain protein [Streblomastix strix]|uniref:Putative PUA domain protein n=1 Tax=Streblomastix strix TaxID=222440 RepID=A0A5J4WKB4_9EUKA|nr:MAG: putative PUA domain protein [Streblomastix strix]
MFKKFSAKESVAAYGVAKASKQREVRAFLLKSGGIDNKALDILLPPNKPISVARCHEHVSLLTIDNKPRFFQVREGPFIPTLRILHRYPNILPHVQVDRGAIKHILGGADVMCRGLTTPGAELSEFNEGAYVAIHAEGKQNALGVGISKMSSADIKKINSGVGIELLHYLGDALWKTDTLAT